jgi:predicted RNA-binding Zn-ribbon protein involved in translation (DUF1610 family)
MSNAVFACEKCGYSQAIDPVHIGSVFSCPTCGNVVEVTPGPPDPAPRPVVAQPVAPGPQAGPGAQAMQAAMSAQAGGARPGMAGPTMAGQSMAGPSMTMQAMAGGQSAAKPSTVKAIFGNVVVFVVLYLLFMAPAFFLPSLGVNPFGNVQAILADPTMMKVFAASVGCNIALVIIGLLRGMATSSAWYVLFPLLAGVLAYVPGMDFMPFMNVIPHAVSLIIGVGLGLFRS